MTTRLLWTLALLPLSLPLGCLGHSAVDGGPLRDGGDCPDAHAADDDAGAPTDSGAARVDAGEPGDGGGCGGPGVDDAGAPLPEPEGSFTQHSAGGLSYRLYEPASADGAPLPLVVMLHGCTQDGAQLASATRMNAHAEAGRFLVAYPDQPVSANPQRCWNWFRPSHQARGAGEPAAIIAVVDDVKARAEVDPARVYVAGLSSGAAMAVVLAATYPDVFDKAAVVAGLEYKAATSDTSAFTAMMSGGPSPVEAGRDAYAAMGEHARVVPLIVVHGTSDYVVAAINGAQVVSQWAVTNDLAVDGAEDGDIDDVPEELLERQVPGGRAYTVRRYHDESGAVVIEKIDVEGMGHAWPGGVGGSFTDPDGPDASALVWSFFQAE